VPTTARSERRPTIPAWLVGAKVLLAGLLVVGAAFPDVGGFAGKGMLFRLPLFLLPSLVVPGLWLRHHGTRAYAVALDAALTVPFLLDTAANGVGLYDHVDATDDVLHVVNWVVLVGGITAHLVATPAGARSARAITWMAGAGLGAALIIGWEVAEHGVMRLGVSNLSLTYGDTLGDLVGSTLGGAIGAAWAVRRAVAPPDGNASDARGVDAADTAGRV
jgi:hypothetical protein